MMSNIHKESDNEVQDKSNNEVHEKFHEPNAQRWCT